MYRLYWTWMTQCPFFFCLVCLFPPSLKPDLYFLPPLILKHFYYEEADSTNVHSPCVYEWALNECIFTLLCPVPPVVFISLWMSELYVLYGCVWMFCLLHQRSYRALSILYLRLDIKFMCLFLSVLRWFSHRDFAQIQIEHFCNSVIAFLSFLTFVWACESLCLVVTFK